MGRVLEGLKPEKYFYYFEEISRIPRSSGEEKAVSDYVVAFAKERGLKVYQDEAWNVYISKPATPGYENHRGIILQGHLDMVCVRNDGVEHDFSKDPIDLVVDGDWVKANGTTLGADNGTAVAMMMMILDSDDVEHPALQCIFTTAEEVGLVGASQLHPDLFEGDILINLDGGSYESLLIASAGNSLHLFDIDLERQAVEVADTKKAFRVSVANAKGGHSGGLAHVGQANAVKVVGDLIADLAEEVPMETASFTGGDKMNAIAVSARAEVVVSLEDADKAKAMLEEWCTVSQREYRQTDPDMTASVEEIDVPATVFSKAAQDKVLAFADLLVDGAYKFMDAEKKDMAKTSCNIGILKEQDGKLHAECLMRSNSDYMHKQLMRKTDKMAKVIGIEHKVGVYSGAWENDVEGPFVKKLIGLYETELGYTPKIVMTHGGMEPGTICGLAKTVGKQIEAMNMGVKSSGAHTTEEKMCISAVQPAYEWLQTLLKNLG